MGNFILKHVYIGNTISFMAIIKLKKKKTKKQCKGQFLIFIASLVLVDLSVLPLAKNCEWESEIYKISPYFRWYLAWCE